MLTVRTNQKQQHHQLHQQLIQSLSSLTLKCLSVCSRVKWDSRDSREWSWQALGRGLTLTVCIMGCYFNLSQSVWQWIPSCWPLRFGVSNVLEGNNVSSKSKAKVSRHHYETTHLLVTVPFNTMDLLQWIQTCWADFELVNSAIL